MTYELNIAELDSVSGGTSIEDAVSMMKMWNAAITLAGTRLEGEGGIVGGSKGGGAFGPPPGPGGGGCHGGCH